MDTVLVDGTASENEEICCDYAESIRKGKKSEKNVNLEWISATSIMPERLFSRVGIYTELKYS